MNLMLTPSHARSSIAALALLLAGSPTLFAQGAPQDPPPPPDQPDGVRDHGPDSKRLATDPEVRRKFRENVQRRIEERRHELELMEQAIRMFDEGKTWDEIRQALPDLPRMGMRGEGGAGREHQFNPGGPMPRDDQGGDPNRLGPGGMGPSGTNPAGPNLNKQGSPEQPRVLTEEDRQSIREILAVTSPGFLSVIRDLEKKDPAEAERRYTESFPRLRFLLELRKRDPVVYELRLKDIQHGREAVDTAKSIAAIDKAPNPDATKRAPLEKTLRDQLTAQYNVRTQIMERDAERMRADLDKRTAQQSGVVEKNLRDLIEREKRRMDKPQGERRTGPGDRKPRNLEPAPD